MNIDRPSNYKHTLTWIELLPKDCTRAIRIFLAKLDFACVMNHLEIATNSERKWINACKEMESCGKEGIYSSAWLHTALPATAGRDVAWLPSISHIVDYIAAGAITCHPWGCALVESIVTSNRLAGNYHNNLDVFQKISQYIDYHIATIHQIIENIKKSYRSSIAIPVEFARRIGWSTTDQDTLCWYDNKTSFMRYINEDITVSSYRTKVNVLLDKIIYNCGHLRSVRYWANEYKKSLYMVTYE